MHPILLEKQEGKLVGYKYYGTTKRSEKSQPIIINVLGFERHGKNKSYDIGVLKMG
jgi:hypothetical protein